MQILKKNVTTKNTFFKLKKLDTKLQEKRIFYLNKNIKNKPYRKTPFLSKDFYSFDKQYSQFLALRVTANNIFCILRNNTRNKTICSASSGKYNIKTSKKTLRFAFKFVLTNFIKEIKTKIKTKNLLISIVAPIKLRKKIVKFLAQQLFHRNRKTNLILKIKEMKCFNGCRPKKVKRKKRKRFKILK